MDREEALRLLGSGEEGTSEWNRRIKAGEQPPNLSETFLTGANLTGVNLKGADLSYASLTGANLYWTNFRDANLRGTSLCGTNLNMASLRGADLTEATLSHASLRGANLCGSHLTGADLGWANLGSAHLTGASLCEASLCWANLGGADLTGADLTGAVCHRRAFINLDLSEVRGLEAVRHNGPSSVGTDTLFRSGGKIPAEFLRGCGVPEELITHLPNLLGSLRPIQFCSCFISHSSKDHDFSRRLHSRLRDEKLRVWLAPEDMKIVWMSREQFEQITPEDMEVMKTGREHFGEVMQVHDKLLLVLSESSMASAWIEYEIRQALLWEEAERRVLFPIRVCSWDLVKAWQCFDSESGQDLSRIVREYDIPDFSKWKSHDAFEAAAARLLKDLSSRFVDLEGVRERPGG